MKCCYFCIFVAVWLGGCAPMPTAQYVKIDAPGKLTGDEVDTFSLRTSEILIEKEEAKEALAHATFGVSSVPKELQEYKIAIRRADSWGIRTNIALTKIENTSLIKEIGVDVTDTRSELISKYGGVVTKIVALIPFAAGDLDDNALPKHVDVLTIMKYYKVGRDAIAGIDVSDGVTVDFGPLPVDAKASGEYVFPVTLGGIMYPACRTATVKFKYKDRRFEKSMMISDARFFSYVAFPKSGKISFHGECGVSQSTAKEGPDTSAANITDALLAQGKAIKDALDATRKKN